MGIDLGLVGIRSNRRCFDRLESLFDRGADLTDRWLLYFRGGLLGRCLGVGSGFVVCSFISCHLCCVCFSIINLLGKDSA